MVSTEIDSRLSFDTEKTIEVARKLVKLYAEHGFDKTRILFKIAATWEGVQAAKMYFLSLYKSSDCRMRE